MEVAGINSNSYMKHYPKNVDVKATDVKADFAKVIEEYAKDAEEKIRNGETEPSYQIGGQSFTEEEWKKLIQKIDKDIDEIKEAQEKEEQAAEDALDSDKENPEFSEKQICALQIDNGNSYNCD